MSNSSTEKDTIKSLDQHLREQGVLILNNSGVNTAKEAARRWLKEYFDFYSQPENSIGVLAFLDERIKELV